MILYRQEDPSHYLTDILVIYYVRILTMIVAFINQAEASMVEGEKAAAFARKEGDEAPLKAKDEALAALERHLEVERTRIAEIEAHVMRAYNI